MVRGPRFNPGWLSVFLSSLKNIPKPFLMRTCVLCDCACMYRWLNRVCLWDWDSTY